MTADSAVPPTTTGDYEAAIRKVLVDEDFVGPYRNRLNAATFGVADAIRPLVAAEVAAARADDVERICAVCRLLLNSGDITPMGARLIEQAADRSVTSRLGAVRD